MLILGTDVFAEKSIFHIKENIKCFFQNIAESETILRISCNNFI